MASLRSQDRSSVNQIQMASRRERIVIRPALRRWACSENIGRLVSQPWGFSEPFDSGQSGKAIPASMLVVKAPSVTRTKTHAPATAAKVARAGL